jgi:hypothetical protein
MTCSGGKGTARTYDVRSITGPVPSMAVTWSDIALGPVAVHSPLGQHRRSHKEDLTVQISVAVPPCRAEIV